jgi:hypothetical protein
MKTQIEILRAYADAFRELVNARVWAKDEKPHEALRLNRESDWNFVCVAMDVIDDASLAIANFLRFGLDGPSRYEDVGECYLRLYGLLSAAYVQQQAVYELHALMNCPSPKLLREQLSKLEITALRHQHAAHSLNFVAARGQEKQAFVPVRIRLAGFDCIVAENRGEGTRTVKLDRALEAHLASIVEALDSTYEKSVTTFFRGQEKQLKRFRGRLEDLRFEKAGNLIVYTDVEGEPREIRVVLVAPQNSDVRFRLNESESEQQ